MSKIVIKNLSKKYSSRQVLKDVNFEIEDGELTVITGLKESGKTTLIRAICGLDAVEQGEIFVDGVLVNKLQPKDRNMALITSKMPLNPNASLFENASEGLRLRKFPKEEIEARVNKAFKILGLSDYARRLTKNLTPGQKCRLLLARAVCREPKIVIVDDILSGVEAGLRKELRNEIVKLNKRLNINFIYVTENSVEALVMGDKIAFMENGVLTQYGKPYELYDRPNTLPIATFFGSPKINLFKGTLLEKEGKYYADAEGFTIELKKELPLDLIKKYVEKKKEVTLAVRAEDFYLYENGELSVAVDACDEWQEGKFISVLYSTKIKNPQYFNGFIKLEEGALVNLSVDKERLLVYDTETEDLIG